MLHGLEQWSRAVGVSLEEDQAAAMRSFWALVLETNAHTNLTRITDDEDATLKHFVDSLSVLQTDVFTTNARVADVGTGAGFPGVPLKIVRPDLRLTLIDSTLKRVRFLQSVVQTMGLTDVQAMHARSEQLGKDEGFAGTFDVVVARAVARLERLLPLCLPLLRKGGYLVAMKGPDVEEEVRSADSALRQGGGAVKKLHRLQLPEGAGDRTLIIVEKRRGDA